MDCDFVFCLGLALISALVGGRGSLGSWEGGGGEGSGGEGRGRGGGGEEEERRGGRSGIKSISCSRRKEPNEMQINQIITFTSGTSRERARKSTCTYNASTHERSYARVHAHTHTRTHTTGFWTVCYIHVHITS